MTLFLATVLDRLIMLASAWFLLWCYNNPNQRYAYFYKRKWALVVSILIVCITLARIGEDYLRYTARTRTRAEPRHGR